MASSGTIGKINAGGNDYLVASTAFATCDTAASTAAKVATIQDSADFTLIDGVTIHVHFLYENTASNPTLNVNNTGALPIVFNADIGSWDINPGPNKGSSWRNGTILTLTYRYDSDFNIGRWYINESCHELVLNMELTSGSTIDMSTADISASNLVTALQEHIPVRIRLYTSSIYNQIMSDFVTYEIGEVGSTLGMLILGNVPMLDETEKLGSHIRLIILFIDGTPTYFSATIESWTLLGGQTGNPYALVTPINIQGYAVTDVEVNGSSVVSYGTASITAVSDVTVDGSSVVSSGTAQLATGTSSGTLAAGDHTHGNITNGGDITTNVAIANGDRLVINDESASKINNSSITFGTSTTQFLANNGTWQTPATGGGVDSTDTSNKIFLIGAETQGTDVSTYSDNQVYATNGQLDANKLRVAETATIQYNSSDGAIEFVFA